MRRSGWVLLVLGAAAFVWPATARADDRAGEPMPRVSRSGYDRVPVIGGPDSVQSSLREHDGVKHTTFYRGSVIKDAIDPYYRFKRRMKKRHGLAFGFDFNMLYQGATAGLTDDQASGGVFRLYAQWTVIGRGGPTSSVIVARIEHRHRYWTDLSPSELSPAIGSLFKTANSFDSWGWGLTNLQWQQLFAKGRYAIAIGQVDLRDWVDTFELAGWRTMLLGAATTYPTNPLPAAGLGASAHAYFRERNTPYVQAGFSDANGKPYDPSFESAFDVAEFYSYVELGWTPAFEKRSKRNLRLTYWHQDARTAEGKPEAWGLSFSGAWRFGTTFSPFLRAGYAHGGVAPSEVGVVAGVGYHHRSHDVLGLAVGWGRPWETELRDQTTIELFYRLQISQNVGITPDLELIVDPSKNPDEDVIAVLSLRIQFAF